MCDEIVKGLIEMRFCVIISGVLYCIIMCIVRLVYCLCAVLQLFFFSCVDC